MLIGFQTRATIFFRFCGRGISLLPPLHKHQPLTAQYLHKVNQANHGIKIPRSEDVLWLGKLQYYHPLYNDNALHEQPKV